MFEDLHNKIVALDEEGAIEHVEMLLNNKENATDIMDACISAMNTIGERFERGVSFLPELIMAGEIMTDIVDIVLPYLEQGQIQDSAGQIVLGTVEGDTHDIGKNIVKFLLEINGFEVIDIGTNVSPSGFITALQETGATILALSALLTISFESMKHTLLALEEAKLRVKVKVMIGGAPVDGRVLSYVQADAFGRTAFDGVLLAKEWISS